MNKLNEMKPVMVIGPVGAGKSTLLATLELHKGEIKKTEAMTYFGQAIDTPGEMITIPRFFNALILNSVRARLILFMMDGHRPTQLPARLALALKAPVVGVVTKIDLASPDNVARARQVLETAGVKKIFEVSSVSGEGLDSLNEWIADFSAEKLNKQ
ncbi:EutP/PduV family microcompartment system protein [Deltaproteobacteria bacterium OttesenSCG-928-M10]|nr:EutP/PduV family microcompartment system protein [Deltaproteobacteria bacterium OttesenSCG-928-M10]